MLKRILAPIVVAGLLTLPAAPSQAVVPDTPRVGTPAFNGTVNTVTHRGSVVYVGGAFTRVVAGGKVYVRRGAAAYDNTTGRLLKWNPRVKGVVNDLLYTREGVYVAGWFTAVSGKPRKHLALVRPGSGTPKKWAPRPNRAVNSVSAHRNRVFVGGNFTAVSRVPRAKLAAFHRRTGKLVGWLPRAANGKVLDVEARRTGVFVAGDFRSLNGVRSYQRLALVGRARGGIITSFNPKTTKKVWDVFVSGGVVLAGIGGPTGGAARAVRRTDGATYWERRFDGDVQAITAMKGEVYVGGHFNTVCGIGVEQDTDGDCLGAFDRRGRGATLTLSGVLTTWNPRLTGDIGIAAFDKYGAAERLLAGGDFKNRYAVFG